MSARPGSHRYNSERREYNSSSLGGERVKTRHIETCTDLRCVRVNSARHLGTDNPSTPRLSLGMLSSVSTESPAGAQNTNRTGGDEVDNDYTYTGKTVNMFETARNVAPMDDLYFTLCDYVERVVCETLHCSSEERERTLSVCLDVLSECLTSATSLSVSHRVCPVYPIPYRMLEALLNPSRALALYMLESLYMKYQSVVMQCRSYLQNTEHVVRKSEIPITNKESDLRNNTRKTCKLILAKFILYSSDIEEDMRLSSKLVAVEASRDVRVARMILDTYNTQKKWTYCYHNTLPIIVALSVCPFSEDFINTSQESEEHTTQPQTLALRDSCSVHSSTSPLLTQTCDILNGSSSLKDSTEGQKFVLSSRKFTRLKDKTFYFLWCYYQVMNTDTRQINVLDP